MAKEVWNMTPLEKAKHWDRCYPGNLNIEMMVNELAAEIERLRAALSASQAKVNTAYHKGQEAMRERAAAMFITSAKAAEIERNTNLDTSRLPNAHRTYLDRALSAENRMNTFNEVAAAIRSLPVQGGE